MKTMMKICLPVLIVSALFTSCVVSGGFVVRERPVEPVYVRPAPPYPDAVWIPGEWIWRGNHYEYVHGYYVNRSPRVWVEGHWRPGPGGYIWVRGHWQ